MKLRVTPTPQLLGFGYDVRLIDVENKAFATLIEMRKPASEGEEIPTLFHVEKHELQTWIDELWDLGIRPTNGAGDANAMKKIEAHLADMRALVFKNKVEPNK